MQPPLPDDSLPSEALLRLWLARAGPGERIVYHRGLLTRDRAAVSGLCDRERRAVAMIANAARDAAEQGLVHLVQRRNGPFDFSYLAIRASRGIPTGVPSPARRSAPPMPAAA
jgi:hypothetical protein